MNDMNYETDIAPRLAEGKNAAAIVAEINAERRASSSNYRAVTSTQVADWLASDGRLVRVEAALAAATAHPAYAVLASAWDGVKSIRSNVNAIVRVGPGEPHRLLVQAAIDAGVMIQSDLDSLISLAYHGSDVTEAQVTQVIADWNSIVGQWSRLCDLGMTYALQNSEATLQQVYDAVVGDV